MTLIPENLRRKGYNEAANDMAAAILGVPVFKKNKKNFIDIHEFVTKFKELREARFSKTQFREA